MAAKMKIYIISIILSFIFALSADGKSPCFKINEGRSAYFIHDLVNVEFEILIKNGKIEKIIQKRILFGPQMDYSVLHEDIKSIESKSFKDPKLRKLKILYIQELGKYSLWY